MARGQGLEQLARGPEAHRHALTGLELDAERLELGSRHRPPCDALTGHRDDRPAVEAQQLVETAQLFDRLGEVVHRPVQADLLDQRLEDRAAGVEPLEGRQGLIVHPPRLEGQAGRSTQQGEPLTPQPALGELPVEQLEEQAGAVRFAGARQRARHADEEIDVLRRPARVLEPLLLEGVEDCPPPGDV